MDSLSFDDAHINLERQHGISISVERLFPVFQMPYLNNILEKPVHEALRQRITVHYNFEGLTDAEVAEYLKHKLHIAGASETILEVGCISAIHGFSRGNPRLIDNLMTDALTLGAQLEKKTIDSEIILAAINNQSLH